MLNSGKFSNEYYGQSMLKFFNPGEEIPECQYNRINDQKLDDVTKLYDHNYGNFILSCTHKKNFNQNVYIPGIICSELCYTLPLIIPSGLPATGQSATVLNSREKAYSDDRGFKKEV